MFRPVIGAGRLLVQGNKAVSGEPQGFCGRKGHDCKNKGAHYGYGDAIDDRGAGGHGGQGRCGWLCGAWVRLGVPYGVFHLVCKNHPGVKMG